MTRFILKLCITILMIISSVSAFSRQSNKTDTTIALAKFQEAKEWYIKKQLDKAKSLFEEAALLFFDSQQIDLFCQANLKVANILVLKNRPNDALKLCEQLHSEYALKLVDNPLILGLISMELGRIHQKLTEHKKALIFVKRADSLLRLVQDDYPLNYAEAKESVAVSLLFNSKPQEALPLLDDAEKLFLADSMNSLRKLPNLYLNKSRVYRSLGFLPQAEEALKIGIDLRERVFGIDDKDNGAIYVTAAIFYQTNQRYHQALDYYKKGMQLYEKYLPNPDPWLAYTHMNMGALFMNISEHQRAREHIYTSMKMSEELFGAQNKVITVGYNYLGFMAQQEGKFQESQLWFEKSLDMNLELFEENNHDVGITCNYLAKLFQDQGKLKEANNYAERSQRIFLAIKNPKDQIIAMSYRRLAEIKTLQKDYQKSLELVQKGLSISSINFENPDFDTNPEIEDILNWQKVIDFLLLKGNVSLSQYDIEPNSALLRRSKSSLLRGVEVANRLWQQNQRLEDLIDFSQVLNELYEGLSQVHMREYDLTKMSKHLDSSFQYTEKGREITLRALTNSSDASLSFSVPDSLKRKEIELEQLTAFYESKLRPTNNSMDSVLQELYSNNLFKTRRELENLQEYFKQEIPEYYDLKYKNEVISIAAIQAQLTERQALLEYSLIDSMLHVFIIRKDKVSLESMAIQASFGPALAYFRNQSKSSSTIGYDLKPFKSHAFHLYQQLLENPLRTVNKESEIRELIIAPPPELTTLSWEIFIQDSLGNQFNQLNYLLRDFSVSYAPSSSWRFSPHKTSGNTSEKLLAFAPVYPSSHAEHLTNLSDVFRETLVPLKWNQPEVNEITSLYGGESLNADMATESNFKAQSPNGKILHLAMHALIDHNDAMNSKLIFSEENDNLEDGMLHTFEIFNMDLSAEMVVLSACNTGIGQIKKGEGVMSLARAFAYAGVPSLVMSHWNANDESTSKLMRSFYEYLAAGDHKDEALRKAKIDFLSEANEIKANPFFWGGFVLVGDNRPINQNTNYYWWLLILPALGFFWLSRKKR